MAESGQSKGAERQNHGIGSVSGCARDSGKGAPIRGEERAKGARKVWVSVEITQQTKPIQSGRWSMLRGEQRRAREG